MFPVTIIIFAVLLIIVPKSDSCGGGVRRSDPKSQKFSLLNKCFGRKTQASGPAPTPYKSDATIPGLTCNFEGRCECWGTKQGSHEWHYASGAHSESSAKKCFPTTPGSVLPNGGFVFTETNSQSSSRSAQLISCKLYNVQALEMKHDWWAYNGRMSSCTYIKGAENCQVMQPGDSHKTLIENTGDIYDEVEIYLLADQFDSKGGIVAADNIVVNGLTGQPRAAPGDNLNAIECLEGLDCPNFKFRGFDPKRDYTGTFENGIIGRGDNPYLVATLNPGEKAYVRLHSDTVFNGKYSFDTFTITDGMFTKICSNAEGTEDCSIVSGTEDVSTSDLVWKQHTAQIENVKEVFLFCSNEGINIGYCALDDFKFVSN